MAKTCYGIEWFYDNEVVPGPNTSYPSPTLGEPPADSRECDIIGPGSLIGHSQPGELSPLMDVHSVPSS